MANKYFWGEARWNDAELFGHTERSRRRSKRSGGGEIELESPQAGGKGSPVVTLPGGKVYSVGTVARFLGWMKPSDGQATNACRSSACRKREQR